MRPVNHLVVFVRAPELGRVKRRLAVDVGQVEAWRLYRRFTAALLRRVAGDRRWRCWLMVTPDRFARRGRFWPRRVPRLAQGPGDLGRRMRRPLEVLPPGPVVIVGTDIPDVTSGHIARAFRALRRHDAVFGPAADGGYWLVGSRRRPRNRDLFRNVRWSTPMALGDTRRNLDSRQRAAMLDVLEDIDDAAALSRWRARRGGNRR